MGTFYEMDYRVGSRDVDLFGHCRPSAVLGALQEAATQASLALGVSGPEVLKKYNALWMVSRNWVELEGPLKWNDDLTIRTWHRGAAGVSTYRDFDIYRDGRYVGQGVTTWVMVDADQHKLMRLKDLTEFHGTDGGELMKTIRLHRTALPKEYENSSPRTMGYSHTDINGHINNTHYADFACDALHLERAGVGKFVRTFQLDYLSECMAGETIRMDTARQGDELYARGVGEDGVCRFDCTITLRSLI